MAIIEAIRDYIKNCPYLEEYGKVMVDFLAENDDVYSIEPVPVNPVIRTYTDGSREEQYAFNFATRFYYSEEVQNNIDNIGFFENFRDWLKQNTDNNIFPTLDEGLTPSLIEATSSGYLFDISGNLSSARYQIQCRLIYDVD